MLIFSWLITNGLYRDLVSACILVPIMHLMALKPLQKLHVVIRDMRQDIEDLVISLEVKNASEEHSDLSGGDGHHDEPSPTTRS